MREESQGSCSVDDSNVFDEELDDSDCRNILYNCLKKLKTRVTEIFDLVNTTNENQIRVARKLEELADAVDPSDRNLKIMKQKDCRSMKSLSHHRNKFQLSITSQKI